MNEARIAVAALAFPAMMLTPTHANADKCTWTPPAHSVFHQDNGLDIQIDWGPKGQGGNASYQGAEYQDWKGPVQGGTEPGTDVVDFVVPWQLAAAGYGSHERPIPAAPTNHYTGTIVNGRASGTTVNDAGVSNTWQDTGGAWTCAAWGFGPTQP